MNQKHIKQSKLRLFVENFVIYGLGSIISKMVPLLMLPIITRLMPETSYFGISDLSNTVLQFGCALAVIGMYDAMYRMFFEKEDDDFKKRVCSTTVAFTAISSVVITIIMVLGKDIISKYVFGDSKYSYLVYITAATTLVTATNQIVAAPTRMQNKRKVYLLANTISPVLSYAISIPLILKGYYVVALPLGALISGLTMEISFFVLNKKWFAFGSFDYALLKQMLKIAIPLFPNFIIYWVFNSSDKIMITNILNSGESGIYSVGSKLGHCSQLIYTAFAGGWQFFAFSTMKEKDQVKSNSSVFEYLGVISFFFSVFVFAICKPLFSILFTGEYTKGYVVSPYLFMAPLMQMIFQVAGNQFLVIKKTWPNLFILLGGASLNIILNLVLIPLIGIEGAAIASLIGYVVSDIVVCIVLIRMHLMVLNKRFIGLSVIMVLYIVMWRILFIENIIISVFFASIVSIVIFILYKNEIQFIFNKIKTRKKRL